MIQNIFIGYVYCLWSLIHKMICLKETIPGFINHGQSVFADKLLRVETRIHR